jgi:hypothetical protein
MQHELILGLIILGAGLLAGTTNYLFYYFKEASTKKGEIFKYLLISIGASLLVPLLLNMLSSDLIKKSEAYNSLNYFVFAGFCFVAGYYSDKFINSIGDKILKDIENTKAKVNTALNEVRKNEEKIEILVSSETESDDEMKIISEIKLEELTPGNKFNDEDMKTQIDKIVKSFNGKYKFRTFTGIAKELNYPPNIVKIILEGLEKEGATKRFNKNDGKEIWALTNIGQIMADRK